MSATEPPAKPTAGEQGKELGNDEARWIEANLTIKWSGDVVRNVRIAYLAGLQDGRADKCPFTLTAEFHEWLRSLGLKTVRIKEGSQQLSDAVIQPPREPQPVGETPRVDSVIFREIDPVMRAYHLRHLAEQLERELNAAKGQLAEDGELVACLRQACLDADNGDAVENDDDRVCMEIGWFHDAKKALKRYDAIRAARKAGQ